MQRPVSTNTGEWVDIEPVVINRLSNTTIATFTHLHNGKMGGFWKTATALVQKHRVLRKFILITT